VAETPTAPLEYKPAVSIEESLASPDQILSLIDGKPYKALKRHLSTHGLTPAEYRSRYGLPVDYPLVAPSYSAARREVARKLGLGGKRKNSPAPVAEAPACAPGSRCAETAVSRRRRQAKRKHLRRDA
jgi:predicted transcriptional regulator